MNEFYIFAPVSSLSKRTRLFKLAKFLYDELPQNSKIIHYCWLRSSDEGDEVYLRTSNIEKRSLLKGGGYGGNKVKVMYIFWMIKTFFYALFLPKGSKVWALGFESAFPLVLASSFKSFKVYYDDADRFSLLFNWPRPLKYLISKLEKLTSKYAHVHIVPNIKRYEFKTDSFYEMKNVPSASLLKESLDLKDVYSYQDKFDVVINSNGWLGDTRGMEVLLKLFSCNSMSNVALILVGKLDSKFAEEIVKLDNVFYLGELENKAALATYYNSDFVFTYYSPELPINQYAESNKWGDAIYTGIGVLVNSEVVTASFLLDSRVAFSAPYNDIEKLKSFILEYKRDSVITKEIKKGNECLKNKYYTFEVELKNIFKL